MNADRTRNRYTFGLGTIGRDMLYSMVSMYLVFYLTDILELPTDTLWWITAIVLAARVFDACNDPVMALLWTTLIRDSESSNPGSRSARYARRYFTS